MANSDALVDDGIEDFIKVELGTLNPGHCNRKKCCMQKIMAQPKLLPKIIW